MCYNVSQKITMLVSLLLWAHTLGEGFSPVEWSVQISSGHCAPHSDPDLTSVLTLLSEILSNNSPSSSLPKSCHEIKNSSPDSPSGYYTLFNVTSGATSITYCDMNDLLFCASSLTSVLEKLQVANIKGEKGDTGMMGPEGERGDIGLTGPTGATGMTGAKGKRGATGITGPAGLPGATGPKGMRGASGSKGAKGLKGGEGSTGPPGPSTGGVVYTHWGRTSCPGTTGAQRVYQGRAGKAYYNQGGGGNYQCMPNGPEYSTYFTGTQQYSRMFGVEYRNPLSATLQNQNVPCAVCHVSTREAVIMIPAKLTCPTSWMKEYTGYLMTQAWNQSVATFECVSSMGTSGEGIPGSEGGTFYPVEANCNGMACPPYAAEKELTCVVCTR